MTENKNPGNDPSAEFERQRKRKVLLFAAILGCIFLVAMWLIFRPAPVKPQEGAAGINTSVPDGKALILEYTAQENILLPPEVTNEYNFNDVNHKGISPALKNLSLIHI